MSDNKGANRLYLLVVALFIGAGLLLGKILPKDCPIYVSLIISQTIIFLPAFLYCRKKNIAVKELIPYNKISFSTGVLVVVTTYLMYPLIVVLNAITLLFTDSGAANLQMEMLDINIWVSILLIAVLPACVEEFVFRGVLFQTYRKTRVFTGIILSAFLFGCMHMNVNQFVYAFVLGIYMAFLVEATGSILSSMLAHFTMNFTSVVMGQVLRILSAAQGGTLPMEQPGRLIENNRVQVFMWVVGIMMCTFVAIGTTIGAVAIYIQICKQNGRWADVKKIFQRKKKEKVITVSLVLSVAMTIVMMVLAF